MGIIFDEKWKSKTPWVEGVLLWTRWAQSHVFYGCLVWNLNKKYAKVVRWIHSSSKLPDGSLPTLINATKCALASGMYDGRTQYHSRCTRARYVLLQYSAQHVEEKASSFIRVRHNNWRDFPWRLLLLVLMSITPHRTSDTLAEVSWAASPEPWTRFCVKNINNTLHWLANRQYHGSGRRYYGTTQR